MVTTQQMGQWRYDAKNPLFFGTDVLGSIACDAPKRHELSTAQMVHGLGCALRKREWFVTS